MAYKSILKCFSEKNIMSEYKNFRLYVDGISYPNTGRYFETDHNLKGKRHMYALVKGDGNDKICSFFNNEHLNDSVNQNEAEIISYLKELIHGACDAADVKKDGEHAAALIYVENGEVYGAGFGGMIIYSFSDDMQTVKRFGVDGNIPDAMHLGSVGKANKYLLSVSSATDAIDTSELVWFFSDDDAKAMDVYEEVRVADAGEHLVTASFCFEKTKKAFGLKALIAVAVAVLLGAIGYFAASTCIFDSEFNSHEPVPQEAYSDAEEYVDDAGGDAKDIIPVAGPQLAALKDGLDRIAFEISGNQSNVAYYIKNLTTGEILSKNDSQMYAANMISMYVMAEIYNRFQSGELEHDVSIDKLLENMIVFNDAESTKQLIAIAGGGDIAAGYENITRTASELDCTDTVIRSGIDSPDAVCTEAGNMTSVKDCGNLLERIYNGALVSFESSEEMYDLLNKSTPRTKILKYLPQDVVVSINKTGEAANVQNDAAVIYTDKYDYLFCVMVNDFTNTPDEAAEVVARMSKMVYDYLILGEEVRD